METGGGEGFPRRRRWGVPRVAAVLLVATAAVAAFAPAALPQALPGDEAGDGDRPGTWRGTGGALGVRAYFNMEPRPLPVDDFLTLHVPDAVTSWDSTGDVRARASSTFPGQTVVGLPDLLATFGVPAINEVLPPYPATAFAGPTNRDVTSADGTSRARIGDDLEFIEAEGRAAVPGVSDALAPFVDVEPLFARSRQQFEKSILVSRSESRLGSVRVAGGLVSVDDVQVLAEARSSEAGEPEATTSVHVGKVSIAGTRVGVRDDGIEVGGMVIPQGGLPDTVRPSGLAGRVNDVIRAFRLSIRPLGSDEQVDGRAARARAGGLVVEAAFPLDGPRLPIIPLEQLPLNPNDLLAGTLPLPLPDLDPNVVYRTYLLSVVIGEANADVYADSGFGGDLGDLAADPDDGVLSASTEAPAGDLSLGPSESAIGAPTAGGPTNGGGAHDDGDTTGASRAPGDAGGGELVLLGTTTARRIELLTGVLALAAALALAGVRLVTLRVRRQG